MTTDVQGEWTRPPEWLPEQGQAVADHRIGTREEWAAAREELLVRVRITPHGFLAEFDESPFLERAQRLIVERSLSQKISRERGRRQFRHSVQ